jgi:predicted SnoaL-like aldol condensation-catalyzing enzyme
MQTGVTLIDRFNELLDAGDIDQVVMLYATDGEIVRYDVVARGAEQIADYYRTMLAQHPGWALNNVGPIRHVDDVIVWDALIDTANGVLETVDVVIVDADGKIRRHIPGIRGFWGD